MKIPLEEPTVFGRTDPDSATALPGIQANPALIRLIRAAEAVSEKPIPVRPKPDSRPRREPFGFD